VDRAIERIQEEIATTVQEMQALRRAQVAVAKGNPTATARRIYELARKLDTLYAEKRAVNAPCISPQELTAPPKHPACVPGS
jgi:hypothetical protein